MRSQSRARIGAQSAQQLKIAAMSFDEAEDLCRHQGGSRTEHCRHSCGNATTGACDSEGTENSGCPTASSAVTRPSMSPGAEDAEKTPQKQHEDCTTKYNEIKMDKKLRSAQLRTENKKQTVFDSEGKSDLRLTIRHQKGSRVIRWVTLTTPAKTVVRRRNSRENESSNRSSMCHGATVDFGRDRRSDEDGPTRARPKRSRRPG